MANKGVEWWLFALVLAKLHKTDNLAPNNAHIFLKLKQKKVGAKLSNKYSNCQENWSGSFERPPAPLPPPLPNLDSQRILTLLIEPFKTPLNEL